MIYRGCVIEIDGWKFRWYRNSSEGGSCNSINECKEQIDWYFDEE